MKKLLFLFFVFAMSSCKSNQKETSKATEDTEFAEELFNTETSNSNSPNVENVITKRIEEIWSYVPDNMEALDKKYCSKAYCEAYALADKYCEENGYILLDADHYLQGQDISDKGVTAKVVDVTLDSELTATAQVVVNNFTARNVVLKLVFENDNWFIDDFISSDFSEKSYLLDMLKDN